MLFDSISDSYTLIRVAFLPWQKVFLLAEWEKLVKSGIPLNVCTQRKMFATYGILPVLNHHVWRDIPSLTFHSTTAVIFHKIAQQKVKKY